MDLDWLSTAQHSRSVLPNSPTRIMERLINATILYLDPALFFQLLAVIVVLASWLSRFCGAGLGVLFSHLMFHTVTTSLLFFVFTFCIAFALSGDCTQLNNTSFPCIAGIIVRCGHSILSV